MNTAARLVAFACTSAFTIAGCSVLGGVGRSVTIEDCQGALLATRYIAAGQRFHDRVRVTAPHIDIDVGLRLVTETRPDELVVVVFTAFGTKVASVRQRGERLDIDWYATRALPIAPKNLLRDLQRIHFLSLPVGIEATDLGGFTVLGDIEGAATTRRVFGPREGDAATIIVDPLSATAVIVRDGCNYSARFAGTAP
jgi:hypothetical protein